MWQYRKAFPKPEGLPVWFAFRAIAFFLEDCFAEIMATALNFWTSAEITNNRKNSETTGFCIRYEMCVSVSFHTANVWAATPANLLADWPVSAPCSKEETTKNLKTKLWSQPEQLLCACKQVIFDLDDCSPGICCPPCRLWCQPRGLIWCGVWVGRSCCLKGWELHSHQTAEALESSSMDRHLVTAKPLQSQPFPSLNCPFPLPSPKYAGP